MQTTLEHDDTEKRIGTGVYTRMDRLTVDGITSIRPKLLWDKHFFSMKDEFDDEGFPSDTGGLSYRYRPDLIVSEQHWLSCSTVVRQGSHCEACGERALVE